MEASEYGYLLFRAHTIRRFAEEASARGEAFHATDVFDPLKCGLEAQARIVDVHAGKPPYLVLRLRHPSGVDARAAAEACAARFFEPGYERLDPIEADGQTEHVFFSSRVPASAFSR